MNIIDVVIIKAGGATALAKGLGITRPAVLHWRSRKFKVPPIRHAYRIEELTGIPKEEIWKEYFSDGEKPQEG